MTVSTHPLSAAEKARLLRRAHAVARLRHPNLVRMLQLPGGAGLTPVLGNARRLADFTLPRGTFKRFDLEQVVRLLLDVLSGLTALHEVVTDGQAFVHGEVSPQHIYVDEYGTARLVPLLNSHLLPGASPERSLGYAAPERLAGERVDARADVFSVGAMLWEALAGKRLFAEESSPELARAARPAVPAISLAARVRWAEPLCAIAERAIAVNPEARFGTALELSDAIAKAVSTQLSRVDTDAWQEEAPTPVFQPRLHLATLRVSTPPPSVLSIVPSEAPPKASEAPARLQDNALALPTQPVKRRGRLVLGAVTVAVALAAAVLSWGPQAPRLGRVLSSMEKLRAAAQPAMFVPLSAAKPPSVASLPQQAAAAPLVPTLPSSAPPSSAPPSSAPPKPLAAPSAVPSSASPKTSVSKVAPAPARPALAHPIKPSVAPAVVPDALPTKSKGKPRGDDYGI